MCVLRVTSSRKTLSDFISKAKLPCYDIHDKGDLKKHGRNKNTHYDHSGFQSNVSNKEWSDLPGQITDANRFLRRHKKDLKKLCNDFKVCDIHLDFPITLRIRGKTFAQFDFLPPELISLAGKFQIGIEISLYPASKMPKKRKPEKKPENL
jgi:hypothetical protein